MSKEINNNKSKTITFKDFKKDVKKLSKSNIIDYAWKLYQDNIKFSNFVVKNAKVSNAKVIQRQKDIMNTSPGKK